MTASGRLPPSSEPSPGLGDVYFEYSVIGQVARLAAIHAGTGVEVSVVGPASAMRSDLERLALRKLERRLAAPPV